MTVLKVLACEAVMALVCFAVAAVCRLQTQVYISYEYLRINVYTSSGVLYRAAVDAEQGIRFERMYPDSCLK